MGDAKVFPITNVISAGDAKDYDSLVLVASNLDEAVGFSEVDSFAKFSPVLKKQKDVDAAFEKEGGLVPLESNLKRLVFAPTGPLNRDHDDIRRYTDAAAKGMKRAISAGSKNILLAVANNPKYPNAQLVSVLSCLETVYVPYQYRVEVPAKAKKIERFGFWCNNGNTGVTKIAAGLEAGRLVARDLGGGDPEIMAPPAFADYVVKTFAGTSIGVDVISDRKVFEKEYPLFAAVDRAASVIERHRGRIIFLRYEGEGPIKTTLMPVGKGITYDTGGADIKAGGIMAGMSRDKCGAAAVVGFFQTLNLLRPKHIKAIGAVAVARNSVGEDCYVADEIITSRAGLRCRIGNTDAEGRMVMTDVLCKIKELALNEVNPHLFTFATLTGHACLAVGNYTAVMDNGPAKVANFARALQQAGEEVGDMFEISTIRREDYDFNKKGIGYGEDLLQCNNAASSRTPRGHQFPAAFMILASGLDKHGLDSAKPLKYSHLDIAGSGGHVPDDPTGVPILGMSLYWFGDQLSQK
jgi:leucyl aminopeptidase